MFKLIFGSDIASMIEDYLVGNNESWKEEYKKCVREMLILFCDIPQLDDYGFEDFDFIFYQLRGKKVRF